METVYLKLLQDRPGKQQNNKLTALARPEDRVFKQLNLYTKTI
jgi:hypothetical protein